MSDGLFSLESSGQNAFEVTLAAGDPRPADVRIAELREKIHKTQVGWRAPLLLLAALVSTSQVPPDPRPYPLARTPPTLYPCQRPG